MLISKGLPKHSESYQNHPVFDEIKYMMNFYESVSDTCIGFIPQGAPGMMNYATYIYMSLEGTLDSMQLTLREGRITDAYTLVRKLFDDVSGSEFLDANREVLIACIDGKTPKTALDVEESALEVLYEHLDDDMFNGLKKWVYNSPSRKLVIEGVERDYTVTMNDVCFVLSLPLRDMYLELHPELL